MRVVVADGVDSGGARALHRGEVPALVESTRPRRILLPRRRVSRRRGGLRDAGLALVDLGAHGADEVAGRGHDRGLLGDELREGLERSAGGVDERRALRDDGWVVPGGGELGCRCVVAHHGAVQIGHHHDGLGDRGGDDRGARAGSYGHRGARGRARDASDASGGRGAARGARDGRHQPRNGAHLDHARRRVASVEDRAIEPGDPRVCDVDGRVGVRTVDGAMAARPRECAPRGGLGVDKKDPAFLNFLLAAAGVSQNGFSPRGAGGAAETRLGGSLNAFTFTNQSVLAR